jgi:histidinol-phosphate aminotransferase
MNYEYERVVSPSSGLRLHLNENTAGCSPAVVAALQRLTRQDAAFYPDYQAAIASCAARLGVPEDRVLLTNGLDDGILALSLAALRGSPADAPLEAIVVVPAFDMYAACADAVGGRVIEVSLERNFSFPSEAVRRAIGPRTRLIWLTNPHNPTGQVIPTDDIYRIAAAAPQAMLVVDEAYADFSGETLLAGDALDRYRNIVVGRTFAKAYGLAALRAGALVAHPGTLAPLRRMVLPYAVNACAAVALPAAFGDTDYFEWYLDQVRESKALLYAAFDRLGVGYWPSAANFVLARINGDAGRVIESLASRGVYVRDKTRDPGCAGCMRVTAGVVDDTRAFIAALEEVLCGAA